MTTDVREHEVVSVADLTRMPLRIEIESACQWLREENCLRMVTAMRVYDIPEGRKKARLLWGPIGVPDRPDATWPEALRLLADVMEEQVRLEGERLVNEPEPEPEVGP